VLLAMVHNDQVARLERGMASGVPGMFNVRFPVTHWAPMNMRPSFQSRVKPWLLRCFGEEITYNIQERNHRFLEEALERVQASGCTASEAHQLVDYVFNRPVGDKTQETGGVMVTLAALSIADGVDMHQAAEAELQRIWENIDKIRAKQAAKPKHSPLPGLASEGRQSADEISKGYPINSTARQFQDSDGNVVPLLTLIKREPEWADSRIRKLEADINELLTAMDIYSKDPHIFGTRPCGTCNRITQETGRRFGCVQRQRTKQT